MAGGVPELVIFDCDGVLVDSEPLALRSLREGLSELGLAMSEREAHDRFVGRSWKSISEDIEDLLGRPVPEGWNERRKARDTALFEAELQPIPGVADVLALLQGAGIPVCVASSGRPEKIRSSLGLTDLRSWFGENLFSASMVEHGKPAPDLFLLAAREMGFEPGVCAVIEDSVPGVTGAVAAGMTVFAYAADPLADREALAAKGATLFSTMAELPGLLGLTAH